MDNTYFFLSFVVGLVVGYTFGMFDNLQFQFKRLLNKHEQIIDKMDNNIISTKIQYHRESGSERE